MMTPAEQGKVLVQEQYGSRKEKSVILHVLNNRGTFDILRQQKKSAGMCSCDLTSFYDRIVHDFTSFAMMSTGAA